MIVPPNPRRETVSVVEPPPGPGLPSSFEQIRVHTDWRSSWTHIAAGKFSDGHDDCVLFYEGDTGFAEIYETDGQGNISLLRQHADLGRIGNRSRRWTHIVAGRFCDSAYNSLLLADQESGFAAIFKTDGSGNLIKVREFSNWGDWSHITTVRVVNSPFSAVLRYKQSEGMGEILECDSQGRLTRRQSSNGWRTTWSHVVGGFGWGDTVLFYEDVSGHCELYRLTHNPDDPTSDVNALGELLSTDLPPGAATVVAGSFGRDAGYCFYYREAGHIQFVYGIDWANNVVNLAEHYEGLGDRWDLITPGAFWTPDDEDYKFGDGRFSSLLFYDRTAGRGEFFLHEPFAAVEQLPLAGYTAPGSVRPGESIQFFVNSTVGPYAIRIYRLGLTREFVTDIVTDLVPASPQDIPRLSYRLGPRWDPVATLHIPDDWPSGLYVAHVGAGLIPPIDGARPARVPPVRIPVEHHLDIPFVVKAREAGSQSNILVFVNDTTYEAYNFWGGRSVYGFRSLGTAVWTSPGAGPTLMPRGFRLSFRRPFIGVWPQEERKWTHWEEPLARWLARQEIHVEWATLVDLHENPGLLDAYTLVVSAGHAEYFSDEMYDGLRRYIHDGGNAAFFSGNNCWWRIRIEDDGDTMVCYKDDRFDPENSKTINWTDHESGSLVGTVLGQVLYSPLDRNGEVAQFVVRKADHWAFYNTGLQNGDSFGRFGSTSSVVGYETDKATGAGDSPWKTLADVNFLVGTDERPQEIATMRVSEKNGTVFTASTTDWTLGLSQDENSWTAVDQITLNIFRRLGGLGAVCDVVGFDSTGAVNMDRTNIGWRSSWEVMIAGPFVRTDRDQLVLYTRAGGALAIVGFDNTGLDTLNRTDDTVGSNWTTLVAGDFIGNHRQQVLLYDKATGDSLLVGFDGSGAINLRRGESGWRTSWDLIVAGPFIGNGRDQVLLYDRADGTADIVGFDSAGKVDLDTSNTGWRTTWDWMVAGHFFGKDTSEVWLCDRGANFGEIVAFDHGGNFLPVSVFDPFGVNLGGAMPGDFLGLNRQQLVRYADQSGANGDLVGIKADNVSELDVVAGDWRNAWDWMVVGRFKSTARSEFLLYTAALGAADMFGRDGLGNISLQQEFTGWRSAWALAASGRFLGNGRDQVALYDRGSV